MSSGKPIVSVPIPDVVKFYGDYVELADDYASFLEAIDRCIDSPSIDKIKRSMELAKSKSWDTMVKTMIEGLKRVIEKS
jgi:glycosyltransferase involved in cell wall biosynthesis